ncbi:hypothetical protein ACFLYJ_03855 [Candidatus Cloacimonadota bacterium]
MIFYKVAMIESNNQTMIFYKVAMIESYNQTMSEVMLAKYREIQQRNESNTQTKTDE